MSTRLQTNPDVVYRPEGLDGAILFNPDTGQVEALNLTGAFIWERLDGTRTTAEVCAELCGAFDECPDRPSLEREAEEFIELLVARGLAAPCERAAT